MRLRRRRPSDAALDYARALLPARRTLWREARWCAIDLELTGLDRRRDEIISFGVVPIEEGRLRLGEAVSGLVRPNQALSEDAIRVHGIRLQDLSRAPQLQIAITPLLRAIMGRAIVVHTASVERAFLGSAVRAMGARLRGPIADTEALGRLWLYKREGTLRRRLALGQLAAELGLPADGAHDALGDALTTAQVFIALCAHLDQAGAETVGSLTRASRRLDSVRTFQVE
jgi:DNA polymerase-3 subunit epsilon